MNTLSITQTSDRRVKVTVHSEGERDLSAVVPAIELIEMVTAATVGADNAPADDASQETPPPLEQD